MEATYTLFASGIYCTVLIMLDFPCLGRVARSIPTKIKLGNVSWYHDFDSSALVVLVLQPLNVESEEGIFSQ